MLVLTKGETDYLVGIIDSKIDGNTTAASKEKLLSLSSKLSRLTEINLNFSISPSDVEIVTETIAKLDSLFKKYSESQDMSDVNFFDLLKREISGYLVYFSTYKDLFLNEVSYLEDVLKKELRVSIVMDIKDSEQVSFTQAKELVEKDARYTRLRDQLYEYKVMATRVKTKYDLYSKLWQGVFQSVSTASKERMMMKND